MHTHKTGLTLLVAACLVLASCGQQDDNGASSGDNTAANNTSANNTAANNAAANNTSTNNTSANNAAANNTSTTNTSANNGGMCEDVTVYADADGDGQGVEDESMMVCLLPGDEPEAGYSREAGDCADGDPLQYERAEGICGDNVDDDCDGEDEDCPTSQPMMLDVPEWDCQGAPPANVYAWARFEDGGGYLKDGGCFVFFEGAKDVFYAQRVGVEPAQECESTYGCVCPSLGGWESFDRRLYAFTLRGDAEECEEIALVDHAGEEQPVSNSCRKYLYQLYRYDIPYSHVASSVDALEARLSTFSSVEVACLEDSPHENLPFASLLVTEIERNEAFAKK